jgi:hypothetical protein
MRITIATIDDFCDELAREAKATKIWKSEVFTRVDRAPEQPEKLTWLVVMWATAAVQTPEGDYILEFGAECGSDDKRDPDGGTKVAAQWLAKIKSIAESFDLTMRKGKLELI